jgi:hypothetical protein
MVRCKSAVGGYAGISISGSGWVLDDCVADGSIGSVSYPALDIDGQGTTIIKAQARNAANYCARFPAGTIVGELLVENGTRGLHLSYLAGGSVLKIGKLTVRDCTTGVYVAGSYQVQIQEMIMSGVTTEFSVNTTYIGNTPFPYLTVQRWQGAAGASRMYYTQGVAYRNTAEARSGACLQMAATSATVYNYIILGTYRVTSVAADIVLSIYAKDDATFDGDVELMALMNGQVAVEWTAKTMDTSYGEHTLTVDTLDLIDGEWLELIARVRGTAGNVYFDDFSAAAAVS